MELLALESLARFLEPLSNTNLRHGDWVSPASDDTQAIQVPFVVFASVIVEFIEAAYENKWLDLEFDWPEWANTPTGAMLLKNPDALTISGPSELSRLLTVCIRRDKFVEGALLSDFESGLILRIVKRAAVILGEIRNVPATVKKLSSLQAGGLGELLALAKINSLGLPAYMSPEGAPGHDIIVIANGEAKSIEVKTRQFIHKPTEITRWPVNLETKCDADFFLFVELNLLTISPTFYLLTNEQARETNTTYGLGQGNCHPAKVRLIAKKNEFAALFNVKRAPPLE